MFKGLRRQLASLLLVKSGTLGYKPLNKKEFMRRKRRRRRTMRM